MKEGLTVESKGAISNSKSQYKKVEEEIKEAHEAVIAYLKRD